MSRVVFSTINASARTIFRHAKSRFGRERFICARISSDGSDRVAESEGFSRRQKSVANALRMSSSTPTTKRNTVRTKASLTAIIPSINPSDSFGIWAVLLASSHFGLWAEKKPWGASLGGACLISALTTLILANLGKSVVDVAFTLFNVFVFERAKRWI
jgi:hypothetical protein